MKKQILNFCILFSFLLFKNTNAQINYQWAKPIGSEWKDVGNSIAVDGYGNSYITGRFGGIADFDPSLTGTANLGIIPGIFDCFFAKYDANGNYLWAKKLGLSASSYSWGTAIAVDVSGNVYITGFFEGIVDFNSGGSSFSLTSTGSGTNCFFAKYDSNGTLVWAKQVGGTEASSGTSIATDGGGNVYLAGGFSGIADFDSTIVTHRISAGLTDVFFAKYYTNGNCAWVKSIGGSSQDAGLSIATDGTNVYLTGTFQDTNFRPAGGSGTPSLQNNGAEDVFFAKYNSANGNYIWAKGVGSSGQDLGHSIALDGAGNIYLSGSFQGTVTFDAGSNTSLSATGLKDIFFAKYANNGDFRWANKIGSTTNMPIDSSSGLGITVAHSGNVYLTGYFNGIANFNPAGGDTLSSNGKGDLFFAKYDSTGSYKWAQNICSDSTSIGYGIAVDTSENIYLTGSFKNKTDFDPGDGIAYLTTVGNFGAEDIFFAKYRQGTSTISGTVKRSNGVAIDSGIVKLFTYSVSTGAMHLAQKKSIDSGGTYGFDYVCADSFIVLAIADTNGYPLIASTFSQSTTHWNAAQHIIITAPNTTATANIVMIECSSYNGPAMIGGRVREGLCYGCRTKGEPIPSVPIGLEGEPGGIIKANTVTNDSGDYSFTHLPVGSYKIYVNIPGLPMDSTYHIHITSADTLPHLDFTADSSAIYINPTTTSVKQIAQSKINMQVVPNPNRGFTTIEFTMADANWVQLDAYNLLGEKVAEILNERKQAGIVRSGFNSAGAGLKAGIYLLKLKVGDEISTIKMIQVE